MHCLVLAKLMGAFKECVSLCEMCVCEREREGHRGGG